MHCSFTLGLACLCSCCTMADLFILSALRSRSPHLYLSDMQNTFHSLSGWQAHFKKKTWTMLFFLTYFGHHKVGEPCIRMGEIQHERSVRTHTLDSAVRAETEDRECLPMLHSSAGKGDHCARVAFRHQPKVSYHMKDEKRVPPLPPRRHQTRTAWTDTINLTCSSQGCHEQHINCSTWTKWACLQENVHANVSSWETVLTKGGTTVWSQNIPETPL